MIIKALPSKRGQCIRRLCQVCSNTHYYKSKWAEGGGVFGCPDLEQTSLLPEDNIKQLTIGEGVSICG